MQYFTFVMGPQEVCCASIDTDIAYWFRDHLTPMFANILLALSGPGSAWGVGAIIALGMLLLLWKRHWFLATTLVSTVGGGAGMGESLKLLVQRSRPFVSGPFGEWGGYSFPSGHTIAATLLYGFLGMLLFRILPRRRWKWLAFSISALLIIGVGFSRVALGAHYLSDVLAAMTLGSAWVLLCPTCLKAVHKRFVPAKLAADAYEPTESMKNPEPQGMETA